MQKILMINNSAISDTSGSSVRARRYYEEFKKEGFSVSKSFSGNVNSSSVLRTFTNNFLASLPLVVHKFDIVYSISDLYPDALCGIIYKLAHPKVRFICGCHCIITRKVPARSKAHYYYSRISQKVILWLLKLVKAEILVSNNYDKEILVKKGFKKIRTVYPAPNF
jgi:hypothetical protein